MQPENDCTDRIHSQILNTIFSNFEEEGNSNLFFFEQTQRNVDQGKINLKHLKSIIFNILMLYLLILSNRMPSGL